MMIIKLTIIIRNINFSNHNNNNYFNIKIKK